MIACPERWTSDSPLDRLTAVALNLGPDEVEVLTSIALRLKAGELAYGRLDIARDSRDFRDKEAREEIEDALVYFACAWLKAQLLQGGVR